MATTSSNRTYAYKVNDTPYTTKHQYITGAEIKEQAGIPADHIVFLVRKGYDNELIEDGESVNLAMPGIEKFITCAPAQKQLLIVNDKPVEYAQEKISYEGIVKLAGETPGTSEYTVVYFEGPKENPSRKMYPGDIVYVQHKMVFNVTGSHLS